MSQDPLQYLPPEKWCELQNAFKKDWPRGVAAFSALEMQKQWIERGIDCDFKVYCPFGEIENGMVAVNAKYNFYEVIIQCPSDDVKNLEAALRKTKIIDWKKYIIIPFVQYNIIELIKTLLEDKNVEIDLIIPSGKFILETKTTYKDVNLPKGMTFELLTNEYLDLIDSTWPHRYPFSPRYFQHLIDNKYGFGLYINGTLISWVLINESGNLLHMYTVKEYRQKGYGELILKLVCNIIIEDGKIVSAYCVETNYSARKLYEKVGFVQSEGVAWCYLRSKLK